MPRIFSSSKCCFDRGTALGGTGYVQLQTAAIVAVDIICTLGDLHVKDKLAEKLGWSMEGACTC